MTSSMRDACWWRLGAVGHKGGHSRRSSAAIVGTRPATGDGEALDVTIQADLGI